MTEEDEENRRTTFYFGKATRADYHYLAAPRKGDGCFHPRNWARLTSIDRKKTSTPIRTSHFLAPRVLYWVDRV